MSHHTDHHHDPNHHQENPLAAHGDEVVRTYILTFLALFVLLGVTVAASWFPFGNFGIIVAMTIAIIKATLIVLFFMHVKDGTRLIWVFSGASFLWLVIMIGLLMSDYLTRGWYKPVEW